MTSTHEESIASLQLLIHVAKADGVLRSAEREALQEALQDLPPSTGPVSLDALLKDDVPFDELLARVVSPEAQQQTYASAFAVAYADQEKSREESALLKRMRKAFAIDRAQHDQLRGLFAPSDTIVTGKPLDAPAFAGIERSLRAQAETRKTAIVSAVLGAFPVPGLAIATDLAIAGLQIALVHDIGRLWGREIDRSTAKGILASFGIGTGARIAVSNLLKLLPGWGAAFGAASAYASSFAVGQVIESYFERGGGISAQELKAQFGAAKTAAAAAYASDRELVEERKQAHHLALTELHARLARGEITQAQFEAEAANL